MRNEKRKSEREWEQKFLVAQCDAVHGACTKSKRESVEFRVQIQSTLG